ASDRVILPSLVGGAAWFAQSVLYNRTLDPADHGFHRVAEGSRGRPRGRRANSPAFTHQSTIQHKRPSRLTHRLADRIRTYRGPGRPAWPDVRRAGSREWVLGESELSQLRGLRDGRELSDGSGQTA